jgi:DNA (cytosine-5)-methyltransferase 1
MTRLDEFVTVKEASEFLGVSPNTLRNWHRDGKIPVHRNPMNGYRLFKKRDLEKLLKQIDESGEYPTGWPKRSNRKRKLR